MALNTRATGSMEKPMDRDRRHFRTEHSMTDYGKTESSSLENAITLTESFTKETGRKVSHMAKELKLGLMVESMMAIGIQGNQ